MFCTKCGKEIGDAKFCSNCGTASDNNVKVTVNLVQNNMFVSIKDKIKQIGQGKLIKLTAWIATIINIIIRVNNNEIDTVYVFLAQDDYFVLSQDAISYMLIVMVLQILISVFLYKSAKKEQINISKGTIILSLFLLAVQILAMLLRLPAPY